MTNDESPNGAQTRGPAAEHDEAPTFWTAGGAQPTHERQADATGESPSGPGRRGSSMRWMMAGLGAVIIGSGAFLIGQNVTNAQAGSTDGPTSVAVNSQTASKATQQAATPGSGSSDAPAPATSEGSQESTGLTPSSVQSSASQSSAAQSSSSASDTSTTSADYVAPFPADTVTTCGDDSASAVHELSPIGLDYVRTKTGTNSGCNLVRDIAAKVSERVAADPNVSYMTFTAHTTRSQANIANKNPDYAISCTRENHLAFCQGGVRIRVYVQR